jgi:hypothetical protein
MKKAVPVTQNALFSCFALFVADLYFVDAFCCNILICGLKAKTQLLVCNKMHQQNINQQQIRQNN